MRWAASLLLCGWLIQAASEPAQVTFGRAVEALSAGDYPAAEQGFQTVLKQQPNNIGAIGNLGILYARTNRIDKAVSQYQRALQLSPNDEPILLNLGLVYLKEELHSRALPYFERVLAIDPHHQQARQLLDVCRLYSGQVQPALNDLKILSHDNPQDQQLLFLLGFAYLKSGDGAAAKASLDQMLGAAGPARAQFLLGQASYEAALFPQAEESFLEVERLDPQFPGVHLQLGKVFISERKTDDAIKELKEALSVDRSNAEANYFLGSLLVRENQDREGVGYLEEAKKLAPDSYGVYLYLGRAKLHLGETTEAVKLLEKSVELNPDDAGAEYTLGRALKSSGHDAEAMARFERARTLNARAANERNIPGVK